MTNIYDIVLNFNKEYYEFFEWQTTDNIINAKKISLFLISNEDYLNLQNNQAKVSKEFLNKINSTSNPYLKESINNNICLVCNGQKALGLMFDEDGNIIKKSSLLLDEEEEVIDEVKYLNQTKLDILIQEAQQHTTTISRSQKEKHKKVKDFINKLDEYNDILVLKYLYYECFKVELDSSKTIKQKLLEVISNSYNDKINNLYYFINLIQNTKKV